MILILVEIVYSLFLLLNRVSISLELSEFVFIESALVLIALKLSFEQVDIFSQILNHSFVFAIFYFVCLVMIHLSNKVDLACLERLNIFILI